MPFECSACSKKPPLCDVCVDEGAMHMGGTAGARGWQWAQRMTRSIDPATSAWLDYDGAPATREHALHLVGDLTADDRLREKLARRCWAEARHRWEMLGGRTRTKFG